MKKYLILSAVIILGLAFNATAQGLHLGIKAGADLNKINGKSYKEQFTYGYQAGAFAQIGLTKKFGIQPEVIFAQVNFDTTSSLKDVTSFNDISTAKMSYVKIPLLLNYNPNPFVSLQVGPQFGKLIDKQKNISQNGKAIFKEGDFSMLAGLQLNISKIRVYGRYGIGLSNINDTGSPDKWKSQNVQLGLGLTL